MTFAQKLEKLIAASGKTRAQIAREAGVKPTIINNYINRGSEPMARAAVILARALAVPVDWFVDEQQEWPPPKLGAPAPAQLSDDELLRELARRHRQAVLNAKNAVESVRDADWPAVALKLYETPFGSPIPPDVSAIATQLGVAMAFTELPENPYDPDGYAEAHHASMPGNQFKAEDLRLAKITGEFKARLDEDQFLATAGAYVKAARLADIYSEKRFPEQRETLEAMRAENLASIRRWLAKPRKK